MKDDLVYTGKWIFDDAVTECFGDMLSRSIPGYQNMRAMLEFIVDDFIREENKKIMDIGSSIGGSIEHYIVKYSNNKYVCIDSSSSMMSAFEEKYKQYISNGGVVTYCQPIEDYCWNEPFDVIQSVLTLQFVPPVKRQKVVDSIFNHLNKGGIFVLVEKITTDNKELSDFFIETYHRYKIHNGYSQVQVESKKEALKNVLMPYSQTQNMQMLQMAGFKKIECFWRNLNFAGFIAMK